MTIKKLNLIGATRAQLSELEQLSSSGDECEIEMPTATIGIATLLAQSNSAREALSSWQELASAVLALYKKRYSSTKVLLVNETPDIALSEHHHAMARLLSHSNASIQKTSEWLRACAQNATELNNNEEGEQLLVAAVETLRSELINAEEQQQVIAKSAPNEQQLDDLTEENELLLLQLQQVQEELEHYFIRCKELEAGGSSASQSTPTTYTQPNIATPKQADVTDSPAWRYIEPFYTKLDKLIRHLIFKRQAKVVKKSKLFDKKWYAQTYQDVKAFKGGAALHYVAHGAAEGRDPGPEFSSERYWAMNPDVAEKGTNPLVHYELFGKNEGRYY
ncbi:hypothetical protein DEU29_102105 [Idiomarina aquatica]|uniref:Uncharacterized protein n=1 Tax=Idiomarina aquatica TaxID=1327752 RepID=A0A4R6PPC2_9GAMM|nr:hypothetical protein [Idiomarina aquatica]TDP40205.1 hypothetical protein DEU29_102105 [Idiomarina aquatica]